MELQHQKLINRTYGGASRPFALEPSLVDRKRLMIAEREAIAAVIADNCAAQRGADAGAGARHFTSPAALPRRRRTSPSHQTTLRSRARLAANPSIRILVLPRRYHSTEGYVFGTQTIASITATRPTAPSWGATGVGGSGHQRRR